MKILYHRADLDGIGSAAILYKKFPEAEFIGIDYPDNPEDYYSKFETGETIIFVDCVFEPFTIIEWLTMFYKVIVIDHHGTTISNYEISSVKERFQEVVLGDMENSLAAIQLTWKWCFPETEEPAPVTWLGKFDTWNHAYDQGIINFELGMLLRNLSYDDTLWNNLLTPDYDRDLTLEIIDNGKVVNDYKAQEAANIAKEGVREIDFHGFKALTLNSPMRGSYQFDSVVDYTKHDIMIVYTKLKDGQWRYSIYSDHPNRKERKINCGDLARKHDGGGHVGAAGFQTKTLIKELE